MIRSGLLIALALTCGFALRGGPLRARTTLAGVDVVVSEGGLNCATPEPLDTADWLTIHEAVDSATPGQTIFVCAGNYSEPTIMMDVQGVTLQGPGVTPDDDGVATVSPQAAVTNLFLISATQNTIEGLAVDGTASGATDVIAFSVNASLAKLFDNTITHATYGMTVGGDQVQVIRNDFSGLPVNAVPFVCTCTNAEFELNTVDADGTAYMQMRGENARLAENDITGTSVQVMSHGAVIDGNTFDFTGIFNNAVREGLEIGGDPVTVSDNQFLHSTNVSGALQLSPHDFGSPTVATNATVVRNTFNDTPTSIVVKNSIGQAAHPVMATIGGLVGDANTFLNSGAYPGDGDYLLRLQEAPDNISAQNNNWGLCTAAEIAGEIRDSADDPSLATVDYEPFIKPGGCATASPPPTGVPTPSPTAAPVFEKYGDLDCSGETEPLDAIAEGQHNAGLQPPQNEPCPNLGSPIYSPQGGPQGIVDRYWGDINCDELINTDDLMALLRWSLDLPYDKEAGCPAPDEEVELLT